MLEVEVVGNVYYVELVDRDGDLFANSHFVAFTVEGAIESARVWAKEECPNKKDVFIGDVRRVIRNVIQ